MKITAIISEYNPFHLGHKKQIDTIRKMQGPDSGIVCLMSGNFVQRGAPAIYDKSLRAKAAILSGADLVLELPVNASLSSAEGFADAGVSILSPFCTHLCFGAENADKEILMGIATALCTPDFNTILQEELKKGISFPAARQAALTIMKIPCSNLHQPNTILAVEYCKAILRQNSKLEPMPIIRQGNYHSTTADNKNPSATALRELIVTGEDWQRYTPTVAAEVLSNAAIHTLTAGERAILYRLRSMTDEEFETLPYGAEGLWRKLMHAARKEANLEAVVTAVKSKRYTRSRLDRMVLCAFLGITNDLLQQKQPYTRVLALNDRGREILNLARQSGHFPNTGEILDSPWQELENRWEDYYALFAEGNPGPAGQEKKRRIYYHSENL